MRNCKEPNKIHLQDGSPHMEVCNYLHLDEEQMYRCSSRIKTLNKKKGGLTKLITFKKESDNQFIYSSTVKWNIVLESLRNKEKVYDASHTYSQVIKLEVMNKNEISYSFRTPFHIDINF